MEKTKWINVNDALPHVNEKHGFGEYFESEEVLAAIKGGKNYEVVVYAKGRDTEDDEFWESWFSKNCDDVMPNVTHWMPFEKLT
jgi:hypothetical protein